eukprot:4504-Eustigmatos_ZCMA.PRE.1
MHFFASHLSVPRHHPSTPCLLCPTFCTALTPNHPHATHDSMDTSHHRGHSASSPVARTACVGRWCATRARQAR